MLKSILRVARLVSAAPKLVEQGDLWYVQGTYQEMVELIPKLKRLGLNYDPRDRAWFIPRSKFTPALLEKVKDLLDPNSAKSLKDKARKEKKEQADLEANKERIEKVLDVVKDMQKEKYVSVSVQWREGTYTLTLRGNTFPIKDQIKDVGGAYVPPASWELDLRKLTLESVQRLKRVIDQHDGGIRKTTEKVKDLVPRALVWTNLGVSMTPREAEILLSGDTRSYRDDIRDVCEIAKWSGVWTLPISQCRPSALESLIKRLDKDNDGKGGGKEESKSDDFSKGIPNRKPGRCADCGVVVEVGDGIATKEFVPSNDDDYDDNKLVWMVRHKDKADCKRNLEELKLLREKERLQQQGKDQSFRTLKGLCRESKYFEEGNHPFPRGVKYILEEVYDTYLVVESDESHLWYIEGNSKDGDMWARNNIEGHSMGWRVPLSATVQQALDAVLATHKVRKVGA